MWSSNMNWFTTGFTRSSHVWDTGKQRWWYDAASDFYWTFSGLLLDFQRTFWRLRLGNNLVGKPGLSFRKVAL